MYDVDNISKDVTKAKGQAYKKLYNRLALVIARSVIKHVYFQCRPKKDKVIWFLKLLKYNCVLLINCFVHNIIIYFREYDDQASLQASACGLRC